MASYTIQTPVPGQPLSSSLYGTPVRDAINDLDSRVLSLEANNQKIIKRGRRTSALSIGAVSTETPYMRLDDIPVIAGVGYRIMSSNVNLDSTVDNDVMFARLRFFFSATTGSACTVANGTQFAQCRNVQDNNAQSNLIPISGFYFADTSGFISILVSGARVVGTGTFQFFASAGEPFDLTVEFAGADPGDTGVDL